MSEPDETIRRLWHAQPREENAMPLDEIRARAARFEQKVRRWNGVTAAIIVVAVAVEFWQVSWEPEVVERVGDLLTVAAFVYVALRFRRDSAPTGAATPAVTDSVDFYREQLGRQRDLSNQSWAYVAPFIPGVSLSLFASAFERSAVDNAIVAAVGVALFVGIAWFNNWTARRLQHEIDELG
jgi:hypothetical protein